MNGKHPENLPTAEREHGSMSFRRPVAVLTIAIALVALAAWSAATRLSPDGSLRPMVLRSDPASQALIDILEEYQGVNDLLILVSASDSAAAADPAMIESTLVAYAERLIAAVRADDEASKLFSAVRYRPSADWRRFIEGELSPSSLFYLDDEGFAELVERLSAAGIRAQIARNEAMLGAPDIGGGGAIANAILRDPLRIHDLLFESLGPAPQRFTQSFDESPLLSRDGRSLLIHATPAVTATSIDQAHRVVAVAERIIREAEPGELDVAISGAHAIAAWSERNIRSDMIWSVIGSVVLLQLVFLLAYRSVWSFPLAMLPVASGIVAAFGAYSIFSVRLSPIGAASGAILAGLGVDYCIHYLTRYEARRAAGLAPSDAGDLAGGFGGALLGACVTSMIGFLAVSLSDVPALASFGLLGALGVAAVLAAALTVLPALLALVERWRGRSSAAMRLRFSAEPIVRRLDNGAPYFIAITLISATVFAAIVATRGVGFDARPEALHPRPNPPLDTQARIQSLYSAGGDPLMILIQGDSDQALVERAHELRSRIGAAQIDSAPATLSIATLIPDPRIIAERKAALERIDAGRVITDLHAALDESAFDPAAFDGYIEWLRNALEQTSPPTLKTLREYPGLAATLLPSAAAGAAAKSATDRDSAPLARESIMLVMPNSARRDQPWPAMTIEALRQATRGVEGAVLTGMRIVSERVQVTIGADLARLLSVAAALVTLWLFSFVARSPARVLLCLAPALFGGVMLLAAMAVLRIDFNIVNVIAAPLIVGLGIDDGIFLVSESRRWRRDAAEAGVGADEQSEWMRDLDATFQAITMTTWTTVLAFGSLMFTSTPAIRSLGLVVAIGMLGCWLGAVSLVLPILLINRRYPRGSRNQ